MKKDNNRRISFFIKLIKRLGTSTIVEEVISIILLVIGIKLLINLQIIGLLFIALCVIQNFFFIRFFLKVFKHLKIEDEKLKETKKEIYSIINNKTVKWTK